MNTPEHARLKLNNDEQLVNLDWKKGLGHDKIGGNLNGILMDCLSLCSMEGV